MPCKTLDLDLEIGRIRREKPAQLLAERLEGAVRVLDEGVVALPLTGEVTEERLVDVGTETEG